MKPRSKTTKPSSHLAPYRAACARLNEALVQAKTPSELTDSDKLKLLRLRLFGRIAEEADAGLTGGKPVPLGAGQAHKKGAL